MTEFILREHTVHAGEITWYLYHVHLRLNRGDADTPLGSMAQVIGYIEDYLSGISLHCKLHHEQWPWDTALGPVRRSMIIL